MELIKKIQRYFRNRAVIDELEKQGFVKDEFHQYSLYYYRRTDSGRRVPFDILYPESENPTAYVGERRRVFLDKHVMFEASGSPDFYLESRLEKLAAQMRETAKENAVEIPTLYANGYVFETEIRLQPKQAREDVRRLIKAYDALINLDT